VGDKNLFPSEYSEKEATLSNQTVRRNSTIMPQLQHLNVVRFPNTNSLRQGAPKAKPSIRQTVSFWVMKGSFDANCELDF